MKEELLNHLRTIIAFRTVAPDGEQKRQCLHWIKTAFLAQCSIRIEEGEIGGTPYLLLRHATPAMLWFAHIDVVPGRDDQFTLSIDGDKALGRGTKDMKGATLAFLIAYRDACAEGHVPPVSILITSDEEIGGRTPRELTEMSMFDNLSIVFTPDNGEQDQIVTEFKGAVWPRLIADGKSGHGSVPWKGDNPVWSVMDALHILRQRFPTGTGDDWQMTVSPTQLKASDAYNAIPAHAEVTLDIRFPASVAATPEAALTILQTALPAGFRFEVITSGMPLRTDPAHPMVRLYKRIADEVTGQSISIGREHGSSDARFFGTRQIPAFLHGPRGGELHGEHEWVSIASLLHQIEINKRWLAELGT